MLRTKELFEKTCKDCGKIFRTDKKTAYICPTCKKLKKAENSRKNSKMFCGVKIKPNKNNKKQSQSIFDTIKKLESYNKKYGTKYTYGQFVLQTYLGNIQ